MSRLDPDALDSALLFTGVSDVDGTDGDGACEWLGERGATLARR